MPINTTQLTTDFQTRLNNLGIETPEEILSLTAALNNLTSNRFMSVTFYSQLPDLTTNSIPSGSLVFVEQLNVLMMSVGTQWLGVDGRTLGAVIATNYAWGNNGSGRLGDNTTTNRSNLVAVVGGITTWSQVSAGQSFSLGITSAGVAYGWGYNGYGGLGDNTSTGKSSPVTVVGSLNWSKVSAGSIHSLGMTSAGVAYGWGNNNSGRLGVNDTTARSSPVSIVGGLIWSQVSAGVQHSVGLTTSGVAYGWGYNAVGAVGDNTATNRSSPVSVAGGLSWSQVTAGGAHSLGITSSGVAYAWGRNHHAQLGDITQVNRSSPVSVVGGITTWSQLSGSPSGNSGYNHSLGIAAGVAYAWGSGDEARLGDGSSSSGTVRSSPVTVLGGITNWSQIKAGGRHSLGLTSTGIAYAWGNNQDGQGGNNVETRSASPVVISGGLIGWSQISAGINHSLAIYAYGS